MDHGADDRFDGLEGRIGRLEQELSLIRLQIRNLEWRLGGAGSDEPREKEAVEPPRPLVEGRPPLSAVGQTAASEPARGAPRAAPVGESASPMQWTATREPGAEFPREGRFVEEGPSLERRIGGQVFAVAGALIVIVGLAFFVKVAIDEGWFRMLPPAVRCVGIALVGLGFLGAGEWLRPRVRAIAVAGCNAAGIGGLYVAAYAAFGVFHLIALAPAFALMAMAAAIGLGVALRHGFLSTAVLSLVGAYLVPLLLSPDEPSPYVLPVYLLLLSLVALALAAGRPRPFGRARDVAWLGTGLLGFMWTAATASDHPWLTLSFWAMAWGLHQAELLVTASKGELHPAAEPWPRQRRWRPLRRRVEPTLLSIATTAAAVGIGAIVLHHQTTLPHWLAPAGAFVVTSLIAMVFGGHLRVLRDRPGTDLETLAAAHAAQAGALLITTVALAFAGWVEATAWLAMGVAAVVAGRWIGARALDTYGLVLLAIASARIATYDLFIGPAGVPWTTASPLALAPWTVLVLACGAAWMLTALLMLWQMRDEDGAVTVGVRARMGSLAAALAALAWLAAPAHPDSSAAAVCLAWLAYSLALRAVARLEPRLHLDFLASVVGMLAIAPWLNACEPLSWLASTATIGAHPGLWLAGAIVAVLAIHAWDGRRWVSSPASARHWVVLAVVGAGVAFAASSIEVARSASILADDPTARRAAVSIWWGLWGLLLVVGGFVRRLPPARYVGLALISVGAVKAVVLDLAGVPPLWRVGSFVGLGVLMLGVAVLYGRVSAAMGPGPQAGAR